MFVIRWCVNPRLNPTGILDTVGYCGKFSAPCDEFQHHADNLIQLRSNNIIGGGFIWLGYSTLGVACVNDHH